jgi:diguanylate cyclase (GGDEF)-like protein/PAS domain S-box-containing protein
LAAPQHQLIVTASDASRIMQQLPPPGANKMLDRFLQGYEGHGTAISSQGVEQIISAKAIPVAGWLLTLSLPAAEALAPLHDQQQRLLWATLFLTLLTGALTWLVLWLQLRPVVETAHAMAALADSGQIPKPLASTQQGEIGQLVTGFNSILKTWTQREATLVHVKAIMERSESMAHLASFEWDVDSNTVIWSPEMFRFFGRDPALGVPNLEGQAELYTPASTQLLYGAVGKALSEGTPYTLELMAVRSSGEQCPCIAMGYPQRDTNGRVVRVTGLVQDVSERKQAEAALTASEARWKFAIEGSGDGLWDWNIQTGKAYFSPRYKSMLGFAEAEIGDTADEWSKRIHPADAPGVYATMQPYLDGKPGTVTVEFRMLRKDGLWQWTMGRGMVMERDAEGKALRLIGINTDMTERKQAQMALRESEVRFRTMFELAADAIVLHRGGELVFVNPAAVKMFGAQSDQHLIGKPLLELIHPDDRHRIVTRIKTALESGKTAPVQEGRYLRLDGTVFHADAQGQAIVLEGVPTVLSTLRDTTERRQAQEKLLLAANVFTHAREGITIANADGIIIDVNEAFTRITGYSREEVIGQNPSILQSGRQDPAFYEAMWRDLTGPGHWSSEIWNKRKNGDVYAELITISAVRDAQGATQNYVALFSDISGIKEQQNQLEHIAHFDALTNLPNRRMLEDRLNQAMAASKRNGLYGALMFLDLDNFKPLNDTHGHGVGDLLLVEVARRLSACVREVDTVARSGGDEFVVVLSELDADKAKSRELAAGVAEKIRVSLAALYRLTVATPGQSPITVEHHCSASIGVVLFINHESNQSDVVKWADAAMYQAKAAGRNVVRFYELNMPAAPVELA